MQEKLLLKRARSLRNAATPFEDKLWRHLSNSKFHGHKFRRQHVIDHAIVQRDAARDRRHEGQGYSTIRFTNRDVASNLVGVLEALEQKLVSLPSRWTRDVRVPHPSIPSPGGEGK